jgi:hypothetical protein
MKVYSTRGNHRIRQVAELLDDQGQWKSHLVRNYFLPIDATMILTIKPSKRLDEDIIAWQPESSGVFTVQSDYKLTFVNSLEQCAFTAQVLV